MTEQEKLDFFKIAYAELTKAQVSELDITADTALEDLNIDSLDAVELQMLLEDRSGMTVKDPTGVLRTVRDLLDLIV